MRAKARATIPPWSDVETAYIAGIVDGEGCIGLYRYSSNYYHSIHYVKTAIEVANTDTRLFRWLVPMFGFNLQHRIQHWKIDIREWHQLEAVGERAYQICLRLVPYLKLKKEQAELLIEFTQWKRAIGYRGGNRPYSDDERNKIKEYRQKAKFLNRRLRWKDEKEIRPKLP